MVKDKMIESKKPQKRFMIKSSISRMEIYDAVCHKLQVDKNDQLNQILYDFVKENFYILNLDDELILPEIEKIFFPDLSHS